MASKKRLYKSTEDKVFTGVSSGLAEYLNTSHNSIRFLFVLLTFANGIGLVLYIVLSVLLPTKNEISEQEDTDFYYNVTHGKINEEVLSKAYPNMNINIIDKFSSTSNILSLIIILIGVLTLYFSIVPWNFIPISWRYPVLIIIIGLTFIFKSVINKTSK